MANEKIKISVAVVAYNEEKNIRECLDSLAHLDYPLEDIEVIVVDNNSTDRTREIVREFPRFRLIVNPVRGIAASRNLALRQGRYDFLAFTDADCTVPTDWLLKLSLALLQAKRDDPSIAAVGGGNSAPESMNLFRQAIDIAVKTFWGNHGSVQGRIIKDRTYVDHLPTLNVLYDRKLILTEGSFDEEMGSMGEDVELSYRLKWRGYKLLYVPDALVQHKWRTDLRSWILNMVAYGRGRIWLMKKDKRFFSIMNLVPLALLLCTIMAPFVTIIPLYVIPLVYVILTALVSLFACARAKRLDLVLLVFAIYIITHYSYAIGELEGVIRTRGKGH
ncbi:MAG: glycosyltransferase [bacterium]